MTTSFDVIVIGSGPGGYVCAIRAAQLGFSTACVEKDATLGGTCLNVGCIPSKALLSASEKFEAAGHHYAAMGIKVDGVALDLPVMMGFKDSVVKANTGGIEYLFKKNKITKIAGLAKLTGGLSIEVAGQTYTANKAIVIATGSVPSSLPGVPVDEKTIVTSTGALALPAVPKSMVVIGGGVIGLELGAVWRRLGAEVTVLEYLDRILPGMDGELAKQAQRILAKQGVNFRTGVKVTGATAKDAGASVSFEPVSGGAAETIETDVVLVATGRIPNTAGLDCAAAGVALDPRGRIVTDSGFATSAPGIYAIGDVIAGPMLAHKAEDEGVAVAEILAGQHGHVNYNAIPGVVYTSPEIASVGATEEELTAAGIAYKAGRFPFTANGRARAMGSTDGFVKVLADATTDKVLGVHIIGPEAGTLIAEVTLAIEFGASSEDIARTCHAHPTLNEAVKEAALAVEGRALHI